MKRTGNNYFLLKEDGEHKACSVVVVPVFFCAVKMGQECFGGIGMKLKDNILNVGIDIGVDILSGVLLAFAIYCFAIPAGFPMTGISGVALILYHLFHLPVGVMTIVLNIPIMVGCFRILGKKFYLNSVRTILITSVILDVLGPHLPVYREDTMIAAIFAGVLCGVGYGIVFMRDSSTGGTDFILMAVRTVKPYLSLGKISFIIDFIVIAAGGYYLGNKTMIFYGLILDYILSTVLDKVVYGGNYGKLTMIITDHPYETCRAIDAETRRGATLLKAKGSFSGEDKSVVMCACSNKEMYAIRRLAHKVDPAAFVIILESNEVIGEGFHLPEG